MDSAVAKLTVSAVIATSNRIAALSKTLDSLLLQSVLPSEIILIDASDDDQTQRLTNSLAQQYPQVSFEYRRAMEKGAARQRNQGVGIAKSAFIWFLDDDVILERDCLALMWKAIHADKMAGGVNAMITNQKYTTPGSATKIMYRLMSGANLPTYAGKCIGPAWNLLPEDDERLPEIVAVEWLNTTCTLYRYEALPDPVFDNHFKGYSLMEDLSLSLKVGRNWRLYNARTARIFHDSQPGTHKDDIRQRSKMELVNRYFVMTQVLNKSGFKNIVKLFLLEVFGILSTVAGKKGRKNAIPMIKGKLSGLLALVR